MDGRNPYMFEPYEDGVSCGSAGCLHHVSHPCEGCGRIAGRYTNKTEKENSMNARTPDVTFVGGDPATHRCTVCGALWRLHPNDGSSVAMTWNLRSKECGSCCDNVEMGDQIEEIKAEPCEGCNSSPTDCKGVNECEKLQHEEPILEPADELEWLREQYVVLKQNNDSLRAAYSTVGQEASTLRRALASKAPTLRERVALAVFPLCIYETQGNLDTIRSTGDYTGMNPAQIAAHTTCQYADALIKELANG